MIKTQSLPEEPIDVHMYGSLKNYENDVHMHSYFSLCSYCFELRRNIQQFA